MDIESDELELRQSYITSGARSVRSAAHLSENGPGSGNASLASDERTANDFGSWKGANVMEVQVDTRVEIQRESWDGVKAQGVQTTTQVKGGKM